MSSPIRILLIDDDASTCARVATCLQAQGFEVQQCDDGVTALCSIDAQPPSLIVQEMDLPRLSGVELARAIKGSEITSRIPIIFHTRKGDPRSMIEGINVGAKYYLTKGCEDEEIVAKVKKAL